MDKLSVQRETMFVKMRVNSDRAKHLELTFDLYLHVTYLHVYHCPQVHTWNGIIIYTCLDTIKKQVTKYFNILWK